MELWTREIPNSMFHWLCYHWDESLPHTVSPHHLSNSHLNSLFVLLFWQHLQSGSGTKHRQMLLFWMRRGVPRFCSSQIHFWPACQCVRMCFWWSMKIVLLRMHQASGFRLQYRFLHPPSEPYERLVPQMCIHCYSLSTAPACCNRGPNYHWK